MGQGQGGTGTRGAVVITGASSGIGRACALHLDQRGFRVFAGVRCPEDGADLARASSAALMPVALDVTDARSIAAAAADVAAATGGCGLAGLVNNAGTTVWGPLEFIPPGELRGQLEVNVVGLVAVTQALLPHLRAGRGRVVNLGSLSGRLALPFYGPYAASKFALEALSAALRVELRPWGIRVAIIEPGAVATPIWGKAMAAGDAWMRAGPSELRERYGPGIRGVHANARRLARAARPAAEVARAVEQALTARRPRARYRVGQTRHTRALRLVALLPEALRDWVIALSLPRTPWHGRG